MNNHQMQLVIHKVKSLECQVLLLEDKISRIRDQQDQIENKQLKLVYNLASQVGIEPLREVFDAELLVTVAQALQDNQTA